MFLDHTNQECPSISLFKPPSIDPLLYSLSNIPNLPLIKVIKDLQYIPITHKDLECHSKSQISSLSCIPKLLLIPISPDQVPIVIPVGDTLSTLLPLLKDHSQQRTCQDHPHCPTLHSTVNHIPVHTTVILLPSVSYSTLNVQYMCTLVWYPVMFSCCDKLKESQLIEYIQYIPMQCLCSVVASVFNYCTIIKHFIRHPSFIKQDTRTFKFFLHCPSHLTILSLPSFNRANLIFQQNPSHVATLPLPSYNTAPPILQHCPSHLTTLPLPSLNRATLVFQQNPSHLPILFFTSYIVHTTAVSK